MVVGEGSFVCRSIWADEAEEGLGAVHGQSQGPGGNLGHWKLGFGVAALQRCNFCGVSELCSGCYTGGSSCLESHAVLISCSGFLPSFWAINSPFYFSGEITSSRPPNSHFTSHPILWCILHFIWLNWMILEAFSNLSDSVIYKC